MKKTNPHAWNLTDLKKVKKNGFTVFSTFACGGGSTMGYKRAGFDVIGANDIDPEMAEHYKKNHKPKHYFLCPINELANMELPDDIKNVDILDGSPPCSSFSMSGNRDKDWGKDKHFREGQTKQVLDDLFFDYLDTVDLIKPKVAIAENVKGMLMGNAKGYVVQIMDRFKEIGYTPQLFLLNAADCGVPQRRERVFFCAIRNDLVDKVKPLKISVNKTERVTCGEALEGLELTAEDREYGRFTTIHTHKTWWYKTRPGYAYSHGVKEAGLPHKLWNWIKLAKGSPAPTIASGSPVTHWDEPRALCAKEFIRLGSFPDDYWLERMALGRYIVGMSVPPKMTEVVAAAVRDQWLTPTKDD